MVSSLLVAVCALATVSVATAFPKPWGIFYLNPVDSGSSKGEWRSKEHVRGVTIRGSWPFLNPDEGQYEFMWIDDAVNASNEYGLLINLETLNDLAPSWVTDGLESSETYVRSTPHSGDQLTVKPWSTKGKAEFTRVMNALADHQVTAPGGDQVRFADHPHLYQLGVTIPGLGDFRDRPDLNTLVALDLPDYTRTKLLDAAVAHMQTAIDAFPGKFIWIGRWSVRNDDEGWDPTLDTAIDDAFAGAFDWDSERPTVGWFMENLACETPTISFAEALYRNQNRTILAFQMLQGWDAPFSDPTKTDPCLTADGGPDVGLDYLYANFSAAFADTYISDLSTTKFDDALLAWHRKMAALNLDEGWNSSGTASPASPTTTNMQEGNTTTGTTTSTTTLPPHATLTPPSPAPSPAMVDDRVEENDDLPSAVPPSLVSIHFVVAVGVAALLTP